MNLLQTCTVHRNTLGKCPELWKEIYQRRSKSKKNFSDFKKRVFLQEKAALADRIFWCGRKSIADWRMLIFHENRNCRYDQKGIEFLSKDVEKLETSLTALRATPVDPTHELILDDEMRLFDILREKKEHETALIRSKKKLQIYQSRLDDSRNLSRLQEFFRKMKYVKASVSKKRKERS